MGGPRNVPDSSARACELDLNRIPVSADRIKKIANLVVLASHLAEANIGIRNCVDANENYSVELYCEECNSKQSVDGTLPHSRTCRTGAMFTALRDFEPSPAQSIPTEKEEEQEREPCSAEAGTPPQNETREWPGRACPNCGITDALWIRELRDGAEVVLADLQRNQVAGISPVKNSHAVFTHDCKGSALAARMYSTRETPDVFGAPFAVHRRTLASECVMVDRFGSAILSGQRLGKESLLRRMALCFNAMTGVKDELLVQMTNGLMFLVSGSDRDRLEMFSRDWEAHKNAPPLDEDQRRAAAALAFCEGIDTADLLSQPPLMDMKRRVEDVIAARRIIAQTRDRQGVAQ